jgi:hypothetical protein
LFGEVFGLVHHAVPLAAMTLLKIEISSSV